MSLVAEIEKNATKARFHTPGHSGKAEAGKYDVTELSYSDNLLHPQGAIAALEKKIASVYKAEACFISTQGATTSLWEAIFANKDKGEYLLIGGIHSSVYNALRAFSLRAYHADKFNAEDIPEGVKTVIVTSPDYYGNCLPLKEICDAAHKKGIKVICDAAHGSHFVFSDKLPMPATEYADFTVHSLHKTLPVATGGSVLLVRDKQDVNACALARKILHGTSPSYITLCSIEKAFSAPEKYSALYEEVLKSIEAFTNGLKAPFSVAASDDKTRLVLTSPFSGASVAAALEEAGFIAEMSAENKVVFIVTPNNHKELAGLLKAVNALDSGSLADYQADISYYKEHKCPTLLAFGGKWEEVPLRKAAGRKLYVEVGLYPPGVPLAYSHDVLTAEIIDQLSSRPNNRFGLNGDNAYVIKE